jgi:hypothetical protein
MRSFTSLIFFSLFAATAVKAATLSRDTSGQYIVKVK